MRRSSDLTGGLLIACGVGCLAAAVAFADEGRAAGALLDLAHAPIFGLLALAVLGIIRPRLTRSSSRAILVTWALVVLLGGATELIPGLTGSPLPTG